MSRVFTKSWSGMEIKVTTFSKTGFVPEKKPAIARPANISPIWVGPGDPIIPARP